jgi:hypothetical protein
MIVQEFDLTVSDELKRLLPELSAEELAQLENSIFEYGILDSIKYFELDGAKIVLDGHHRYELAKKHNLLYSEEVIGEVTTLDEAKTWIYANQIGRRNLTQREKMWYIMRHYDLLKSDKGGDRRSAIFKGSKRTFENVRDLICQIYGIPDGTFIRYRTIFNKIKYLEERKVADISIAKYLTYDNDDNFVNHVKNEYNRRIEASIRVNSPPRPEPEPTESKIEALHNSVVGAFRQMDDNAYLAEEAYVAAKAEPAIAVVNPVIAELPEPIAAKLDHPYGLDNLNEAERNVVIAAAITISEQADEIAAQLSAQLSDAESSYEEKRQMWVNAKQELTDFLAPFEAEMRRLKDNVTQLGWELDAQERLIKRLKSVGR